MSTSAVVPACSAAASRASPSASEAASGASQRTCLPASRAAPTIGACRLGRVRDVDQIDLRVRAQRLEPDVRSTHPVGAHGGVRGLPVRRRDGDELDQAFPRQRGVHRQMGRRRVVEPDHADTQRRHAGTADGASAGSTSVPNSSIASSTAA